MRTTALPSILDVLSRNYNNRNPQAAIYELAVEYTPRGTQELPLEQPKARLACMAMAAISMRSRAWWRSC